MFDVGDLPILTLCNGVLKTGVVKWPLKLVRTYFTLLTFFSKSRNMTFTFIELLHTYTRTPRDTKLQISAFYRSQGHGPLRARLLMDRKLISD